MFYFFNVFLGTATEAFPHMDELSMSIDPEQAARAFVGDQPLCVQRRIQALQNLHVRLPSNCHNLLL